MYLLILFSLSRSVLLWISNKPKLEISVASVIIVNIIHFSYANVLRDQLASNGRVSKNGQKMACPHSQLVCSGKLHVGKIQNKTQSSQKAKYDRRSFSHNSNKCGINNTCHIFPAATFFFYFSWAYHGNNQFCVHW